jgi:hypothetical protein
MQDLWDSGAGYMEWLQNKQLVTRAMQGSKLAGAMAATLPIVTAQFAVGLEALKAGLKNVNAYMNRLKKWEQIIDEQTRGRPAAPSPPPPPDPPLAWVSMEDQEASAVWMEDDRLRSAIQAEGAEKLNAATQEFEKTVFPKIYKSTVRPQIVDVIAKSKKAFGEKRRAAEAKQAAFPGRFERTEKRLATARASVQKLEDEDPNHPRLADLRKLRDDYDAELTAITLEWEKFEKTEEPFLVGLHIVNRQFDEWDGILRGDEQSQVYGFQRLENEGRGFPVFHQVHDAELDKHLQAAAAEHRKEVAKKLGVGAR